MWLTAAVGVALIGQQVGELFLSPTHAGALGAALVLPFALGVAKLKSAPPMMVMVLAAFWALVPGALSFESLTKAVSGTAPGEKTLGTTVAAIFSIVLGTLVSWSVLTTLGTRLQSRTANAG